MKKKTKIIIVSSLIILVIGLVTFNINKTNDMKYDLTKISDHLYETKITEDYDWLGTKTPILSGFACSGIQNGKFRGRNYDWVLADTDICVVHVTTSENRPHSSVGVSDMSFLLNEDGSLNYYKLPFATVDGINDAGVCIQVNVMPCGESGTIKHTKSTDDDLPGSRVVRYVLDYAATVEDAIDLLNMKDIYTELDGVEELHWLLSGPKSENDKTIKTVVLEVTSDGLHVIDKFIDDKPVMTNFNISNFDGSLKSLGFGLGYERWQILNKYYDEANSVMGTFDLMEKVYYSKMYDLYSDNFWYSEYNGSNLSKRYSESELRSMLGEKTYDEYINKFGAVYYNANLWDGANSLNGDVSKAGIIKPVVSEYSDYYKAQHSDNGELWITIHTSVYDLENLTLDIQVRESQDHFHFKID